MCLSDSCFVSKHHMLSVRFHAHSCCRCMCHDSLCSVIPSQVVGVLSIFVGCHLSDTLNMFTLVHFDDLSTFVA